jgi:hypothetical protein
VSPDVKAAFFLKRFLKTFIKMVKRAIQAIFLFFAGKAMVTAMPLSAGPFPDPLLPAAPYEAVLPAFGVITPAAAATPDASLAAGNRWDRGILDTAAGVDYLSATEKAVVYEINKLRSNPPAYAEEYLVPLLNKYQGKKLMIPGGVPILTKEGILPLRDAIRELKSAAAVPLLTPDHRLTRSARDHQADQSATGRTGHIGSDGSAIKERVMRYGKPEVGLAQNIFYGDPDPFLAVLFLIIDDGVPGRGHRKIFLDEKYKLVGIATGKHPKWGHLFVMDFAHAFASE